MLHCVSVSVSRKMAREIWNRQKLVHGHRQDDLEGEDINV